MSDNTKHYILWKLSPTPGSQNIALIDNSISNYCIYDKNIHFVYQTIMN